VGPQEATPAVASVQVKSTVTVALFQPKLFGAGDLTPVMVGATVSRLMVIL
jgi:hypothetical protein